MTQIRIGDAERSAAADRLSAHAAAGRITLDELEQRLELVHGARYDSELAAVEGDLPGPGADRTGWYVRRRPPAVALLIFAAAVAASAVIGHPVVPLFILAAVVWLRSRRSLARALGTSPRSAAIARGAIAPSAR